MHYLLKISWSLMLLFGIVVLQAQPDDELPSEQLEVIREFEAALGDSEKLNINPDLPPLNTNTHRVNYDIPDQHIELEYLPPTIRPIAMRAEKLPEDYNGYLKVGLGLPASPYGEFGYTHHKNENFKIGLQLRHHSANNKDIEFQRFMDNFGRIHGSYFFGPGMAVDAALSYHNDQVHFYGFNFDETDTTTYLRDDVKQIFNTLGFEADLYNKEKTEGNFNYKVGTKFARTSDRFETNETNFDLHLGGTKWIQEQYALQLDLISDFTFMSHMDSTQNLHNFTLNPAFRFHKEIFRLKMGASLASGAGTFKVFPDIEASVNIIGKKLAAFAGWQGGFRKNNFRQLSDYNPFIVSNPEIRNSSYFHYFGGIKGRYKKYHYRAELGYKPSTDVALFLSDSLDNKRFQVLYDSINIFNIAGTIAAEPLKNLQIDVRVGQNIYNMKNEKKAWHLPSLEANISLRYTALKNENLLLKAEAYIADAVPFLNNEGLADDLNSLFDISLGAEYFVTKNIGLFINVNNLINNKRKRWNRYPTFGTNLLGGVTARF